MSRRHIGDGIRRKQSQWYRENHPEGFAVKHVPLEVYEEEEARKNGKDSSDQQGLNSHISLNSQSGVRAPRGRSWPKMADKAFSGLAGDVVRLIGPQSESDPNALLLNFLTAFGNEIGRGPYYQVEGTRHYTNLFNLQVGDTAKARKGTAVDRIRQLFSYVDPEWETGRIRSSLGSGEGVISEVRDPVTKIKDGIQQTVDEGVVDKRLMIFASEFASLLTVMRREGNTLSAAS